MPNFHLEILLVELYRGNLTCLLCGNSFVLVAEMILMAIKIE